MLINQGGQLAQEFYWDDFQQGLTRMLDKNIKQVHCIGIGGIGVSGLAELLLANGIKVTGSDLVDNKNTLRLRSLGAKITLGHKAENIAGADYVIYSSAVDKTNPEFRQAIEIQVPIVSRGAALADFVNAYTSFAIAGTHGKTTTTGLVADLLLQAGLDPSYVVGGIINNAISPTRVGKSDFFVAEVDESDASFLFMRPTFAVITNIDADHLETYGGDFSALKRSFLNFLDKIPEQGAAFVCIDDPVVREILPKLTTRVITYGFSPEADIQALNYSQQGLLSQFEVKLFNQTTLSMNLSIPGQHNVQNALAAIAIAHELKVPAKALQRAMRTFPGMGRRFHDQGQMQIARGQATIIDDYGHHPREIKATLEAARMSWPDKRIVCVFQPHRYSRTRDLYQQFIEVLSEVDQLYLLDVYSAGELPLANITSKILLTDIEKQSKNKPEYVQDMASLPQVLYQSLRNDDIVILQGAGDIGSVSQQLLVKHAV